MIDEVIPSLAERLALCIQTAEYWRKRVTDLEAEADRAAEERADLLNKLIRAERVEAAARVVAELPDGVTLELGAEKRMADLLRERQAAMRNLRAVLAPAPEGSEPCVICEDSRGCAEGYCRKVGKLTPAPGEEGKKPLIKDKHPMSPRGRTVDPFEDEADG